MNSILKSTVYIDRIKVEIGMILFAGIFPCLLFAQGYDTPCQAEANPITWIRGNQTQTLMVDLVGASPFVTTNAGGGIQDFGCPGTENAAFYKLEIDDGANTLTIESRGGTATNVNIALISLNSTECGGGTDFGENVITDPAGAQMFICDIQTDDPVPFDLCGLMPSDFNNLYLWTSTPMSGEGEVTFDISQVIGPQNDDCDNPTPLGIPTTNNILCGNYNNESACSERINVISIPPDPNDEACLVDDPLSPSTAGVWFSFTTDMQGELLDASLTHSNGDVVNLGLYSTSTGCIELEPLECWSSSDGTIDDIVNYEVEPNTQYYLLVYTDKSQVGEFDLCIDVKPPLPCLGSASSFYNRITIPPFCQVSDLNQLCIDMAPNIRYQAHPWPGNCPSRATVDNPSWFGFVAGSIRTTLEFEVSSCMFGRGVEIGLFQLPCEEEYSPNGPRQRPDGLRLLSDCLLTECNNRVVEIDVMTVPGSLYGVMIDGCNGDLCEVEVNVINGEDAPDLTTPSGSEIIINNPDPNFANDTFCVGATGVEFMLDQEVPGACFYLWQVNGMNATGKNTNTVFTYDFPNPGTYTIELLASNYCSSNLSNPITKEIVVSPLPPFTSVDTICEGDFYRWIGPYGNEIVPDRRIETDIEGDYSYTGSTQNAQGCVQQGTLNLHIRNENDDTPTPIDTIVCAEELPLNIFGSTLTGNVEDLLISAPIAQHGCDSFFNLNITVLGGNLFTSAECDGLGNVIFRFVDVGGPQTPWFEQFDLFNDPNNLYTYETEFIAVEKDSVISTSVPMTLSQQEIEFLAENGALNIRLRIRIFYDGQLICNSISPPREFNLDDNFPRIDNILGDTSYCPGQKELRLFAEVHHPLEPAPFGEFSDSIDTYNWFPPNDFRVDSASQTAPDTLILDAPLNPTDNTLCLKVTTERCLFTDSVCRELVIEEPIQPILEDDNETCDTFWSFLPDTAVQGVWRILDFPASGNTAVFTDTTDPNATVSVSNKGEYTFIWAEGSTECAKYDTVSIDFLQSELQGIVSDTCLGLDFVAEVTLINGRGGYTIHPSSTIDGTLEDSVFVSDTIPITQGPGGNFGEVRYLVIEDSLGCVSGPIPIRLVCNCNTEAGSMSNDLIELCEGEVAVSDFLGGFVNDGDDTIMFVLHEGNLSELRNIIDTSFSGEFPFPDGIILGQSYFISAVAGNENGGYVDLNDPCVEVARGQEVVWYGLPNSNAGENDTICGLSYDLMAIPSMGTPTWSVLSGPGTVNFQNDGTPQTTVTVSEPGNYIFQFKEVNQVCADSAQLNITFGGEINYDISYECDSTASTYIATININGGGSEYFLIEGDGSLNNNTFISEPIDKNESRLVIFDSDLACGPDTIEILTDCECLSQLGSFNSDTILVNCEEACINVSALYDPSQEVLDGNDIGTYILHTDPDTNISFPYFFDENGEFCYIDIASDIAPGDTVYVSYVIGNDAGNGEVDISDPCLKVSFGAMVVFEAEAEANAGMPIESCDLVYTLTAMNAGLNGSWRFLSGPSQNVTIDNPNNPTSSVTVDMPGEYLFEWSITQYDCEDADTVLITVYDSPELINPTLECDSTAETYTVSFDIAGGDLNTYVVTGSDGTLSGSQFISDPIQSDSSYRFVVFDGNGCDSTIYEGQFNCDCETQIGSLAGMELHLCEDEMVNGISYNSSGEVRDANDELIFVLEDMGGNRIAESMTASFSFDPSKMALGETYFVRAYLGSVLAGDFQYDESCTQQTISIPVQWYAYPEAIANSSADTITCSTDTVYIDATASNGDNLQFSWSTTDGSMISGTRNDPILGVLGAGTYQLIVTDSLSDCQDTIEVNIQQSDEVPVAEVNLPDTLDCSNASVTLDGSPSTQGQGIVYSWSTNNGEISGPTNGIQAVVTQAGTYTLTVLNTTNDCESSVTVNVINSSATPTAVIQDPEDLTCERSSVVLNGEASSTGSDYLYQWRTNNGLILGPDNGINAEVSEAGIYWLIVQNTQNGCLDSASVEVKRDTTVLSELDIQANDPVCYGDTNGNIRIEALDGNPPYKYILNDTLENSIGVFTNLSAGTYRIEIIDDSGCSIIRNIELEDPTEVLVSLEAVIEVEEGDTVTIEAMTPSGLDFDTIIWDTDSIPYTCIDPLCRIIELLPISDMTVGVRIENSLACMDEDSSLIFIIQQEDTESLYIPNVFTPNGDGINDNFLPETGQNVRKIHHMQIFDRWGTLIYESRDFQAGDYAFGWDGTQKGVELSPAVFTYLIEVEYISGNIEVLSGTVSLLR